MGGPEDDAESMSWLNEPAERSWDGDALTVRARPEAGFWRTTYDGFIRDDDHLRARPWRRTPSPPRVYGDGQDHYAQAGLMVRPD